MRALIEEDLRQAFATPEKQKRHELVDAAKKKAFEAMLAADAQPEPIRSQLGGVFKSLEADVVRGDIIRTGRRIDGRDLKTVRPISLDSARAAAHARLGAVHARRDAGAGGGHARHRR